MLDLNAELRTEIYYRLTRDEALKGVCQGAVRLYNGMADKDAPFPYLVHRLRETPLPDAVMLRVDYYLDLWDYNPSMARILAMRSAVVTCLDGVVLTMPTGGIARFKYFSGGEVPEDTEGIQHYATQWTIRLDRTADIKQRE